METVKLHPGWMGVLIVTYWGTWHTRETLNMESVRRHYQEQKELQGWETLRFYDLGVRREAVDFHVNRQIGIDIMTNRARREESRLDVEA